MVLMMLANTFLVPCLIASYLGIPLNMWNQPEELRV